MTEVSDSELLAAMESGRIKVGYLYRHQADNRDRGFKVGDWEWYQHGTPGRWKRGRDLRDCLLNLLRT